MFNEGIAHIQCGYCNGKFQALTIDTEIKSDDDALAHLITEHWMKCKANKIYRDPNGYYE